MSAIPDYVVEQARATDLTQLAQRYGVALRKESTRSQCGPCPACGGTDRFWIKDNRYTCRGCGINGDSIEFVRMRERCEFTEAVCMLTQYQMQDRPARQMPAQTANIPPAPPVKKRTPPNDLGISKYTKIADDAARDLFTDPYAEVGREYLIDRHIDPHCWQQFHLGFRRDVPLPGTWNGKEYTQPRHPAIVMPWYRTGKCMAIRYRFLTLHEYKDAEGKEVKAKQTAQPGSYFEDGVYGAHALPSYAFMPTENSTGNRVERLQTLVICEGEMNAISIWQTCNPWGWEVLSFGSDSATVPSSVMDYAKNFGRILVWMDRSQRALEEMAKIGPLAISVNSVPKKDTDGKPEIDERGKVRQMDANDLLKAGLLGGFLATVRLKACRSDDERTAFRYDLSDADLRPPFLEDGTRQVLEGIR